MKRRSILCMPFLGLFNSVVFSKSDYLTPSLNNHTRRVFNDLSVIFADPSSAATLGKEYLAIYPYLDNSEQLFLNLGVKAHMTSDENLSLFERQRSEDYMKSNTAHLDGWVLSMAEVSLCCAMTLLLSES